LENAKKMYSSTMDDWLRDSIEPFFSKKELNDQDQRTQEEAISRLNNNLKFAGDDFNAPFYNRLQTVFY